MIGLRQAACCFLVCLSCGSAWSQQKPNPAIERRIDALLKQMTIEEKAGQLSQFDGDSPQNLDIIKQGQAGSLLNVLGAERTNAAQKIALEQTRLKIPLIFGFDVIHGYRTI